MQAWPEKPATTIEFPVAVEVALPLIKEFEGCRLTAYPDPETGGKPWTIGRGSNVYDDGAPVKRGDRISQELADALLAGRLERDYQLLGQRIPCWRELGTNQQAALLSFTYNSDPACFGGKGFTTITKVIQAGELEKVPAALMLYVNSGGLLQIPLFPALTAGALLALLAQIPPSLNAAQRWWPVVLRTTSESPVREADGGLEGLGSLSHRPPRHAAPRVLHTAPAAIGHPPPAPR